MSEPPIWPDDEPQPTLPKNGSTGQVGNATPQPTPPLNYPRQMEYNPSISEQPYPSPIISPPQSSRQYVEPAYNYDSTQDAITLPQQPQPQRAVQRRERPPIWALPQPQPMVTYAPQYQENGARTSRPRGFRIWFPFKHLLVVAGIVSLLAALNQPWGFDSQGVPIFLSGITLQIAQIGVASYAVLGTLLIGLRQRIGCLAVGGCLLLLLVPLLLAIAVVGVVVVTQLHMLPQLNQTILSAPTERGIVLWYAGNGAIIIGLLVEVITRRRKA